ncbi:MAG: hypothetical protein HYV28_00945, partial [Ignavibacteriales bacterium]|nr:hypothetical protein [Ignavibacteriales bacterium]
RIFNPATKLVTLSTSNTAVNNVDFTDISQIPVSGYITHEGTTCPVDTTVEILVDGESWSPKVFVDKTGKYLVEFPPGSTHTLAPSHKGYLFSPASYTIDSITAPVSNKNFTQFQKYAVKVIVAGGKCEFPLGGLNTVTITSIPSCYSVTLSDTVKEFTFTDLPPVLFKLEVTRQDLVTFDAQNIDLRDTNVLNDNNRTVRFIYHSPLIVKIDTLLLPVQGDCGTPRIVLSQLNKYVLHYSAGEQYAAGFCPSDSISFAVYNYIGDEGAARVLTTLNGTVADTIVAGYPNVLDGGPHPFQKQILVKAATPDNRLAQNDFWAFVAGVRPRIGQTFVSRGPDMPLMILRAPPGDFSWSYWGQSSSHYTQMSISQDTATGGGVGTFISFGAKFEAQAGLGFAIGAEVKPIVEFSLGYTSMTGNSSLTTVNVVTTATENITTPMDPIHTGHNSDVYIGAAYNFVFGLADSLYFQPDSCIYKKKTVRAH